MSVLDAHVVVHRPDGFDVDVEIRLEPGRTVALLGPNGAGKSTVVEVIAGHLGTEGGHVLLGERVLDDGNAVFVPPERRRVGVVFQDYLLFDHLNVIDNVAFGLRVGRPARAARAAAAGWLAPLGLSGLEHRRPRELSGGQAQRVALARALAPEPEVLLLDEPLAALDVRTRNQMRTVLATHLETFEGPRLLITHEPMDAFLLADEIVVMEHGRVVQRGTPEDIRRRPATGYVAALAGTNLLGGSAHEGAVHIDDHGMQLTTAMRELSGRVLVTIAPAAVALYPSRPDGSPRNTWATVVDAVEGRGDVVRVQLGEPLPLMADITPGAAEALDIGPGREVWASVKATEVTVNPG